MVKAGLVRLVTGLWLKMAWFYPQLELVAPLSSVGLVPINGEAGPMSGHVSCVTYYLLESTLTHPALVSTRTRYTAHLIWFGGNEEVGARIPTKWAEGDRVGAAALSGDVRRRGWRMDTMLKSSHWMSSSETFPCDQISNYNVVIGIELAPRRCLETLEEGDDDLLNHCIVGTRLCQRKSFLVPQGNPWFFAQQTGRRYQPTPLTTSSRIDTRGGGGGPPPSGNSPWNLNVSAGELLGHTHEELVLLLIQLRRQSAGVCKAMEMCHVEIEAQARLAELDTPRRLEHLQKLEDLKKHLLDLEKQKLEDLKKHLLDLEKQYEKGKPLVNLVDNMVKLGSLYRGGGAPLQSGGEVPSVRERLEFNQKVQEQRLLAQEKRDWDRLSPDQGQLQAKVQELYRLDRLLQEESGTLQSLQQDKAKVQELYRLDRLLQEESGTLQSLQQDKELLEKALGGLRHKLQGSRANPAEAERYRKQQRLLEKELSRIRLLLAHNSKKLEETVAENARLEQELVVLRQKWQASRRGSGQSRSMPMASSDSGSPSNGTTVALEAELRRVQQLVGDLQRQRQELSMQVRQLTEKSHSLVQQMRPGPTGVAVEDIEVPPYLQDSSILLKHPIVLIRFGYCAHFLELSFNAPKLTVGWNKGVSRKGKGAGPIPGRKRHHSTWLETDLDSLVTLDHGLNSPASPQHQVSSPTPSHSPLYVNADTNKRIGKYSSRHSKSNRSVRFNLDNTTDSQTSLDSYAPLTILNNNHSRLIQRAFTLDNQEISRRLVNNSLNSVRFNLDNTTDNTNSYDDGSVLDGEDLVPPPLPAPPELPPDYPPPPPPPPSEEAILNGGLEQQYCTQMDISEADDRMKRFYGIIPREKQQEIKTVRIVKRESERRQRDRDRSGNIGIPITNGNVTGGGKRIMISEDTGEIITSPHHEKSSLGRVLEEDTHHHETDMLTLQYPEDDPVLAQFHRSMSLPRGFGKRPPAIPPPPPVRVPSPRSDSVTALRNLVMSRQRVRFESCSGGSSSADSTNSQRTASPNSQNSAHRQLTAHEQLFGGGSHIYLTSPGSSEDMSPQLSPVFKSEAARAIVMEMASMRDSGDQPKKRVIPREKRRHHTVSSGRSLLDVDSTFSVMGSTRSCDDLDMERALRPRLNAPDVVRSTMSHKDFKYNENTIDSILGTPNKIVIPERYIPEQAPELSAEEQLQRMKKAESIRKMLSETSSVSRGEPKDTEEEQSSTLKKKMLAEKKQREHLLQLNQILAKQVMEKSKIVAVKALATLPLNMEPSFDEDDLSPVTPLPLFQQRDNYYS
uniref:(California timema) hypothetical protein n=1 Tax=Timema californicum TaxID=61474 RepID=A0A7R9P3R5_TIMCA|nr:unnamed protein product [Timema californicum]